MASTTAPTAPSATTVCGTAPPLRQLWQVPTFVLGLLAFAAVCLVRPPWHGPHAGPKEHALADLRDLLSQPEFDKDRALAVGAGAVRRARTAAEAGEAHFLFGSAFVVLAERAGPGAGREEWREARSHLEQAEALGVPEEDRPRLAYRLGKAWAYTGEPPRRVIEALAATIDGGADDDADAVRGYGLLAEAYLKLPQPDREKALAATEKQINRPVLDPRLLAPARLTHGELLLRLGRAEEESGHAEEGRSHAEQGREALKNIGAGAPPALVARARRLRVRSLEGDELWAEAVAVWRDVLSDGPSPQDRASVLYHLGLCLRNSNRADEALHAWEECLTLDGTGDEGRAAALGVAELRLRVPQIEPAVTAFERAVRDLKGPGDWPAALVPLPRACEVFEAGCRAARAAGAFEAAVRLARLYERLAPPGRAQELSAEAADAWARATQETARATTGDAAQKLCGDAQELMRQAGAAYLQAADVQKDPAEQAERLWLAANRFLEGNDPDRAIKAFERFKDMATRPDMLAAQRFNARLSESWYKLAHALKEAGQNSEARHALEQASALTLKSSPYVYRARYELALSEKVLDAQTQTYRWSDSARDQLEKNLSLLRTAPDRDEETRENTLFALGDLYFQRREQRGLISRAIETLEEALRDFPGNPSAVEARYQLAESYRLRADHLSRSLREERLTAEARLSSEQKVMQDREKAIANYQELSRALRAKASRDDAEERLLVYALSAAADVRFWAGGYDKSGEMYEAVADYCKSKKGLEFEYCSALANMARAYSTVATTYPSTESDYDLKVQTARGTAQRALREIRAGLTRLDPEARQSFEKWLKAFDEQR